jgi:hypothetical protein
MNTDESMPRVLNYNRDGLPPGAVYIGRLMPQYGLPGSKWHNPYKVGRDGTREEVIARYERHLDDSGLIDAVRELRGRDLVCWCAPEPCHGHLLLLPSHDCRSPVAVRVALHDADSVPDHEPTGWLLLDRDLEGSTPRTSVGRASQSAAVRGPGV